MFKQSKLRTQRQQNGIFIYGTSFMLVVLVFSLNYIDSQLTLGVFKQVNNLVIGLVTVIFSIHTTTWLIRNKAHKGLKHAIYHYHILLKLRKAFLDANYYNKRVYFNIDVAELPKVKLEFYDEYSKAKLFVENINLNKDIGDVSLSFVLVILLLIERIYQIMNFTIFLKFTTVTLISSLSSIIFGS